MSSKVQIVNQALGLLGVQPIISLSDNVKPATLASAFYDDIAREVMSEGPWTSAIFRQTLAETSDAPNHEYTNQFQLPSDPEVLVVLDIYELAPGDIDYRIEGDKLLTDESSVKIRYIGFQKDTESYDPMLQRAIVYRLANAMAYAITGKQNVEDALWQRYNSVLADGLSANNIQGSRDIIVSDDLTANRRA